MNEAIIGKIAHHLSPDAIQLLLDIKIDAEKLSNIRNRPLKEYLRYKEEVNIYTNTTTYDESSKRKHMKENSESS